MIRGFAPPALALVLLAGASSAALRGVSNFRCIDGNVCRGAQPTAEGLHSLASRGIKTILDLRGVPGWEAAATKRLGLGFVHISLNAHQPPAPEKVAQALSTLEDVGRGPVFVHCEHGDDRTGLVIACYRIAHDHWTNRRALNEARSTAGRNLVREMEEYILHFQPPTKP